MVDDNQLHAREGEKILNSAGLRRGKDESKFRSCLRRRGVSASDKERNTKNATTGGLAASRVWGTTQNERHCTWERLNTRLGLNFRENAHNLTFPPKRIIIQCLAEGKFPTCLKISKVISLPPVAIPRYLNDLRPIAITVIMYRIMERILINSFVATNYAEKIEAHQHGFRLGGSTENALTRLQNDCRHFQLVGFHCFRIISLGFFKDIGQSETPSPG